jgi:transaldolase
LNIYLESTSLDEIRRAVGSGLADGIVLPESEYDGSSSEEGRALIEAISQEFAIPVSVSVSSLRSDDMYRDAKELAKITDNVVVQLPLIDEAVTAMHRLAVEGVDVCADFVVTAAQAVLAAKAGATSVRISLQDLDAHGRTSSEAVANIRSLLDAGQCECDVMVASPATSTQFTECIMAGAQIVSIRNAVLESLLLHPLTDRGMDRFLSSLGRRSRAET